MKSLSATQKWIIGLALVPMVAVGVAGGIGTYSNISHAYGSGTAIGALGAGEGATAVLALLHLGLTLLGQSSPAVIRIGLWALPAAAAVMAATAATEGTGQVIVYAVTPMAITASAEGVAFLVRRVVVYREGRDAEAEDRASAVIRDLAYHQARAASHPSKGARKRSTLRSWRLARKVGQGDATLGVQLLDIQRTRLTQGADVALARMFQSGGTSSALPSLSASAGSVPALPVASEDDVMASRDRGTSIQADTSGYPADTDSDQQGDTQDVRPSLEIVRADKERRPSIASDVRQMVSDGVSDVRHVLDAIATRHGRPADDQRLRGTVVRYFREARKAAEQQEKAETPQGHYL